MKANQFIKYSSFEDLKQIDKPRPEPKPNQILVQVKYSSTNAMEWHIFRGVWMVRIKTGLFKPSKKYNVLGADISGEVISVGSEVKNFKKGDQVLGDIFMGGYAEFAIAEEHQLAIKPENVSHKQAAAIPVAGMTALKAVRDIAKIKKGDHVLINGASGGVGTYAVQMAKHFGAKITAVCSGKNVAAVQSLGADEVINYEENDFAEMGFKYDYVIDIVGNKTPKQMKAILKPQGLCIVVGMTSFARLFRFMVHPSKQIKIVQVEATNEVLATLADLLSTGAVSSHITAEFSLNEVSKAIKNQSEKHVCGKQVVCVGG